MKEYYFIQCSEYKKFEKQCSDLLKAGWTAQGGICVISNSEDDLILFQAFVR